MKTKKPHDLDFEIAKEEQRLIRSYPEGDQFDLLDLAIESVKQRHVEAIEAGEDDDLALS